MCHFITLGVPAASDDRLHNEFSRDFRLIATMNPCLIKPLPPLFVARLLMTGTCSCDLYWDPSEASTETPEAQLRSRYRKLGWSASKIDRALAEILTKRRHNSGLFSGLRPDVAAGILAVARANGPVAVIVHWYSGDVDSESFAVTSGPRYRGDDFLTAMSALPVDTLVWAERDTVRSRR